MGFLDWFLKQSRDELASESKKGNTGVLDWVLKQSLDKMASKVDRNKDLESIRSSFWTYRFDSYEDAISFLDSLKLKYQDKNDREMKDKITDAFRYAKEYWHKGTK